MKMKKFTAFLLLTYIACVVKCSRILVVFPMPARSHYILGSSVARTLVEAGHDVTLVSPFEAKDPPKGGKYLDVTIKPFDPKKMREREDMKFFEMENMNPFLNIPFMNLFGDLITRGTLEDPNFIKLVNSNATFDAVILEQFGDDGLKFLAHHYKAHLILFSTIGANTWVNTLVGNPAPLSYIPDVFLSYSSDMTFKERLMNFLFTIASQITTHLVFFPAQNKLTKNVFPDAPDLSTLLYNSSLVLLNSHESTNQPVPLVPNMIEVGGYHINPPKELPKDLKEFMDNATEGVIYFSMGSNVEPSQMPAEKRDALVKPLGKLKQKVLWKWDEDTLPGKPDNFKISKWFPQQDILAHPNIKLFITHGGLLSTTETVYHGVPIFALPIFGDQKLNAARAAANGLGFSMSITKITEEKVSDILHKLLHDPKYRENAKRRSRIMHDRPVKPKELLVYWTEYVIRHQGAPHLRVAALNLPWYKYLLLDVIAFLILVSVSVIFLLYKLIRFICCRTSTGKAKVKTN